VCARAHGGEHFRTLLISQTTVSDGRMTDELERIWKEAVMT
jgi:hypothetical protein